jgi:hypothetical protein
MFARQKFEVAKTAKDRLREEYANRKRLAAICSDLSEKVGKLVPLEAAVDRAKSDLHEIEQLDASNLRAWVDRGAKGAPPAVSVNAREVAARNLASAEATLKAAAGIKGSMDAEIAERGEELRGCQPQLHAAQLDVIHEQICLSVERMRKASLALLESEAFHRGLLEEAHRIRDVSAGGGLGFPAPGLVEKAFSDLLSRITELNKLSTVERKEAAQVGHDAARQLIGQLLADEDPKE